MDKPLDLKYFFDIATGGNTDLRKSLKGEEDLTKIDDASLLRASLTIGLITDVGYQRLDHIRYMRNHASAAHPNQVSLTGWTSPTGCRSASRRSSTPRRIRSPRTPGGCLPTSRTHPSTNRQ